jgi:hypothetical protein
VFRLIKGCFARHDANPAWPKAFIHIQHGQAFRQRLLSPEQDDCSCYNTDDQTK